MENKTESEYRSKLAERLVAEFKLEADVALQIAQNVPVSARWGELEVEYDAPSVNTIEEARQYGEGVYFWYPAHSIECIGLVDLRALEWMMQYGDPISESNAWDFSKVSKEQLKRVADYIKRHVQSGVWQRAGITAGSYDYQVDDRFDMQCAAGGFYLSADEVSGDTAAAVVWWLNRERVLIVRVNYASVLHNVWLGLIED